MMEMVLLVRKMVRVLSVNQLREGQCEEIISLRKRCM
jgi:hypothetical protein